ncbi:MAG: hypothetical protein EON47_10660, partial [Acetobacteraceae bacterium]
MSDLQPMPAGPASLTGRFHLVRLMARGWWMFLLRGLAGILFGLLAFLVPGLGLAVMLGFLAAWMALDGIGTLYQAVKGPPEKHGVWFWVDGIVSLGAAVALLVAPVASALMLVFITGFWSIAVFIGAWLIAAPGPGLLALIWVVGIQALLAGGLLCWL